MKGDAGFASALERILAEHRWGVSGLLQPQEQVRPQRRAQIQGRAGKVWWFSQPSVLHWRGGRPNEDSCLVAPEDGIYAVADGVGGHQGGAEASRLVVEALRTMARMCRGSGRGLITFSDVQRTLEKVQKRLPEGSGTTLALMIRLSNGVYDLYDIFWCGDSRVYAINEAAELELLTEDDGLARRDYEMQVLSYEQYWGIRRELDEWQGGWITDLGRQYYLNRHVITGYIGPEKPLELHQLQVEPELTSEGKGGGKGRKIVAFLLATDGVIDSLSEETLQRLTKEAKGKFKKLPELIAKELAECQRPDAIRYKDDDTTCMVVLCK